MKRSTNQIQEEFNQLLQSAIERGGVCDFLSQVTKEELGIDPNSDQDLSENGKYWDTHVLILYKLFSEFLSSQIAIGDQTNTN